MPKIEIGLYNITKYVDKTGSCLKEGEAAFKASHIIMYGLDDN